MICCWVQTESAITVHKSHAMTSTTVTPPQQRSQAEMAFLEEQLVALDEVRQDGHVSDIAPFVHDGLCRAMELENVADAQTCDRATRLTDDYRKLLKTLVH